MALHETNYFFSKILANALTSLSLIFHLGIPPSSLQLFLKARQRYQHGLCVFPVSIEYWDKKANFFIFCFLNKLVQFPQMGRFILKLQITTTTSCNIARILFLYLLVGFNFIALFSSKLYNIFRITINIRNISLCNFFAQIGYDQEDFHKGIMEFRFDQWELAV